MTSTSSPFVDALRSFYNNLGVKYNAGMRSGWHDEAANNLVKAAAGFYKESGSWVLDLGTGTGKVAFAAAARVGPSGKVLGIDISQSFIDVAIQRAKEMDVSHYVEFLLQDVDHLSLPSKYDRGDRLPFDVVFCGSALALFSNPAAVLRTISTKLLRPGGVFVADVMSHVPGKVFLNAATAAGTKTAIDVAWMNDPEKTLRTLFEQNNFTVESIVAVSRSTELPKWDMSTDGAAEQLWQNMVVKAPWLSFGIPEAQLAELKQPWMDEMAKLKGSDGFVLENMIPHLAVARVREVNLET